MARVFAVAVVAASLLACGSSGNGDGGTSGGSTGGTSGGTGGCPAVTNDPIPSSGYCNGTQLQTSSCATVYLGTYPESDDIRKGCDTTFQSLRFDAGTVIPNLGGILDVNSYSTPQGLLTVYPAGCEDLGQGTAPSIGTTTITPPSGAVTVSAARTAGTAFAGSVYGIVTYVDGPFYNTTTNAGEDALLYLQDAPGSSGPAPLSGISIYIDDVYTGDAGTNGYPASGLARGDVVAITGLTWSPYNGQDQLAWSTTAQATVLGTLPLPAAVSLSSSDIAGSKGQQYQGMRVTQSDAPDKLVNICPAALYTSGS